MKTEMPEHEAIVVIEDRYHFFSISSTPRMKQRTNVEAGKELMPRLLAIIQPTFYKRGLCSQLHSHELGSHDLTLNPRVKPDWPNPVLYSFLQGSYWWIGESYGLNSL
jgi:hypothetical protein